MARRSKRLNSEDSAETATEPADVPKQSEPTKETSTKDEEATSSTWFRTQHHITNNILPLISQQDELYALLHQGEGGVSRETLADTCQQLFRCIEYLAELQEGLKKKDDDDEQQQEEETNPEESLPCSLSGLHSIYTGIDESNSTLVDMETIWGQVDLQNNVLLPRLKKMIRKLAKGSDGEEGIRLLDMGDLSDEEVSDDDDGSGGDGGSGEGSAASNLDEGSTTSNMDENEGSDEELDEDARRIRERMEKAMADMDGSMDDPSAEEDESLSKSEKLKAITSKAREMEESIDPTREDMRDGFFDLHEMEAFADEEEEYLPDDAYGTEMPDEADGKKQEDKKKVLPHIKTRKGESDSDSDFDSDVDDDSEDGLTKRYKPNVVRRKKYRADDEVEALYDLYNDKQGDDFDDSEGEEEIAPEDMTAADFFGKPDKKLIQRYKSQQKEAASNVTGFDDNDSWDDHDFANDAQGWRNSDEEEIDEPSANESEDEEHVEEHEEDSDTEQQTEKLSTHAIQSKKLEQRTLQIEEDMMAEKPWRMKGESRGTDRPTDSLLDSTPEFEVAFKPPPIITAEHTASIEEVIKKRIIDEDWDDVVPRELPDIGLHKRGGGDAPEVSQEKSKLGLGELYEREYLKKTTGFDRDAHEKETEEGAAKEEMKKLFADLCSKLDALSNYHFAPRPVADDADVTKQNVPAIAMEEVLPLHVSASRGAAPEEVYAGGKGRQSVLKGESEMDQAERKKLRNAKKSARRKARKQKIADEKLISKLQPGLGLNNPYEKRKLREELQMARASGKVVVASEHKGMLDEAAASKEYQTSTKFFQKMQQNVEDMVRGDDQDGRSKKRRKGMDGGQVSSVYKL